MAGLNLIKLSVGTTGLDDLRAWQAGPGLGHDGLPRHVTRMWPKREAELLDGGSIFWVIKRSVLCRQRILRLEKTRWDDGIPRCALVLDPELVRVTPVPRRVFQGWRYLAGADAPSDLGVWSDAGEELPPRLSMALAEMGVVWGAAPKEARKG